MEALLQLAILGIGAGTGYALIGHGIVLIYRGSGTLNFAQGAVAMVTAEIFYGLRDDRGWSAWSSFLVAMIFAGALGVGMQTLVLRQLRGSSALVRLVATLALLTVCMGTAMLWWGRKPATVRGLLPARAVTLTDGVIVPVDRIYLLVIVLLLTAVLNLAYQRTRIGLATAGAAENERAAITLGWSPGLLGGANWGAGCVLAGLAGILLAPIAGLSIRGLTLTVVAGMAAALIGGFSSFWLTMLGGVVIGVTQSYVVRYIAEPGWTDAVPFLAITLLVVLRGQALPLRGESQERPVRVGSGRAARWTPLVIIGAVLVIQSLSREWTLAVATSLPIAIVALSYVVITGYAGQISLAQLTIAGVGAWFAGVASYYWHLPMLVCVIAATGVAVLIGALAGLPALRCRGMNLAVITLGMSVVIEGVVLGNKRWLGGFAGLEIFSAEIGGSEVSFGAEPRRYTLLVLAVFVVCCLMVANVRRGRSGRGLLAIRSNERAAASLGVSVTGGKVFAFTFGSMLAGLGGALAAFQFPTVPLAGYNTVGSITLLLNTVVGGVGFIFGGLQGGLSAHSGVSAYLISQISDSGTEILIIVSSVLVFLTILSQPDGIASHVSRMADGIRTRTRRGGSGSRVSLKDVGEDGLDDQISWGRPLRAEAISVSYGGIQAVSGVDLQVSPGEVLGIIGPNGAGKTTLIDALCGFVSSTGEISLGDLVINDLSPAARARAGLARTFQAVELFDDLSLLENFHVAADCEDAGRWRGSALDLLRPRTPELPPLAITALAEFGLLDSLDDLPPSLPAGRQRLAGIVRALSTGPGVLCLDEPAAGLSDLEASELARVVRIMADKWGLSVIVIEHNVEFVRTVSDRILALDQGRPIADSTPDVVLSSAAVIEAYTGGAPLEEVSQVEGAS